MEPAVDEVDGTKRRPNNAPPERGLGEDMNILCLFGIHKWDYGDHTKLNPTRECIKCDQKEVQESRFFDHFNVWVKEKAAKK